MADRDSRSGDAEGVVTFKPYVPEGLIAQAEYRTVMACMAGDIWPILDKYTEMFTRHMADTALQEVVADALAADIEDGLLPEEE